MRKPENTRNPMSQPLPQGPPFDSPNRSARDIADRIEEKSPTTEHRELERQRLHGYTSEDIQPEQHGAVGGLRKKGVPLWSWPRIAFTILIAAALLFALFAIL